MREQSAAPLTAELMINLWVIYDAGTELVHGLTGCAYHVEGDNERKLADLRGSARTDYVAAKRYRLPARFGVSYADASTREGVTMLNAEMASGSGLFEESSSTSKTNYRR